MDKHAKIYIAGHTGLAGSALMRALKSAGYGNLLLREHSKLELTDRSSVEDFFQFQRPDFVFLAAAKVGGILANATLPADFITQNLAIQLNVIRAAYSSGVQRLAFLGSSCVYPKLAPQPIPESALLSGPLELSNRSYAVAKIAGIEMCWAYNRQFATRFLAFMPCNLYGPHDNYDPHSSHVIPALIGKMHQAKLHGAPEISLWGTGTPRREFLHSDDAAQACFFLMNLPDPQFDLLAHAPAEPPLINVGSGSEITIRELALLIADIVGFRGKLIFDPSKPDGTPSKLMDTRRLSTLGWKPAISLPDGLAATYREYLSSRENIPQPVASPA